MQKAIEETGSNIKFTGERVIEGITPERIWLDHINRYRFAAKFAYKKDVLDISCGSGYGSKILKESGATSVIGIDISKETVDYAKRRYKIDGLHFINGNILNIQYPDNYFDMAVSFETIEHIKEYRKALSEIHRVLKGNCILVISSPNRKITSPGKTINELPDNEYHFIEFSKKEFNFLLSDYFKVNGCYGQRSVYKPFLISFIKKRLIRFFPILFSPDSGSPIVEKYHFLKEYRYLIAFCINSKK